MTPDVQALPNPGIQGSKAPRLAFAKNRRLERQLENIMMHTDATANGAHRVQQDGAPQREYTPKNVLITGIATLRKQHAL